MAKRKQKAPRLPGAKRTQQPPTLYHGDLGPDTAAQWVNARPVPDMAKGGHGKIKQRETMARILVRARVINTREKDAAEVLLNAWEETGTTGTVTWARPFVDSSPVKDGVVESLDAWRKWTDLWAIVPDDCKYPVGVIILHQRRLKDYCDRGAARDEVKKKLRRGLKALADHLRY